MSTIIISIVIFSLMFVAGYKAYKDRKKCNGNCGCCGSKCKPHE